PDYLAIATSSEMVFLDILTGDIVRQYQSTQPAINHIVYHSGLNQFITGSAKGSLAWWHVEKGLINEMTVLENGVEAIAVDPLSRNIFVGADDGLLHVISPEGKPIKQVDIGQFYGNIDAAVSPDG